MAALGDLQAWKTALETARYSGNRKVRVGSTEIEYKSDSEMAAALAELNRQIRDASASTPPTVFQITPIKGY